MISVWGAGSEVWRIRRVMESLIFSDSKNSSQRVLCEQVHRHAGVERV